MRRQQLVPLSCLACLTLLGLVVATGPAMASETVATASTVTTPAAGAVTNQTLNDTAIVDVASTDDAVYLAGTSGIRGGNATVAKRGPDGTIAWSRTYPTANDSVFTAVAAAPDGSVYLLRRSTNRSANVYAASHTLLRLDSSGAVQWRRSLDARGPLGGSPLAATTDGVLLVTPSADRQGSQLQHVARNGERTWTRELGLDTRRPVVEATTDGYLLAGSVGFDSAWMMRLDDDGTVQFNETYRRSQVDNIAGAVETPDGGALLVGQNRGYGGGSALWTMRVGADGVPRSSRIVSVGENLRASDVLSVDDGAVIVGSYPFSSGDDPTVSLTGVGFDGAVQSRTRVPGFRRATVAPGPDRTVTLAGLVYERPRQVRSEVRTLSLPDPDVTATLSLSADAGLDSGGTHYRGQDLFVSEPRAAGETVALVAVPDEYEDFEPHVVRRPTLNESGMAVIETATLAQGRYALAVDGERVFVESGSVVGRNGRGELTFELAEQDLSRVELDDEFVDVAAGERTATLAWESRRDDYVAHVSAERFRGDALNETELAAAFGTADGYRGTTTVHGTPVARIAVDGDEETPFGVDSLAPGLYDVTVRGADTGDAGTSASTRLVVGPTEPRPLSVSLDSTDLRVAVGNQTTPNVTVSGVTHGIGAMSMSANRTGPPALGLDMDLDLANATQGRGSGLWSDRRAEAEASAMGADTRNGTLVVGSLAIDADLRHLDPDGPASNTVTFRLDWVIDERGVPYTVPDELTLTVAVTNLENATGDARGGSGWASGSSSASG
jgi:hypothetical protein